MSTEGQKPINVMAVMIGAKEAGKNSSILAEHDHTEDKSRVIATGDEASSARESVAQLVEVLKMDDRQETANVRAELIADFESRLSGYDFRKTHKLPGLQTQFLNAREQLVAGQTFAALEILRNQPDAAELVTQLRKEYETYEDVLSSGGELDIDGLERKIRRTNYGLEFVDMDKAMGRWRALTTLRSKIEGTRLLARVQKREGLLDELNKVADRFQSDVAIQAVSNLDAVLNRLRMNGTIAGDEEENFDYASGVAKARGAQKGKELIAIALERARRLTNKTEDDPIEIVGELDEQKRLGKIAASLENAYQKATQPGLMDVLPLVKTAKANEVSRLLAEQMRVGHEIKASKARIEMAENYNKLLAFQTMLREELDKGEAGGDRSERIELGDSR